MVNVVWTQDSHCSWQSGDYRIVKTHCPRRYSMLPNHIGFNLFDGKSVTYHASLEEAQRYLFEEALS